MSGDHHIDLNIGQALNGNQPSKHAIRTTTAHTALPHLPRRLLVNVMYLYDGQAAEFHEKAYIHLFAQTAFHHPISEKGKPDLVPCI